MISTTSKSAGTSTLGMYYPAVSVKKLGPLLVATDRTEASSPALRAAEVLNEAVKRGVTVLAVIEPLPLIVPEPTSLLQPLVISPELTEVVRSQTVNQVAAVGVRPASWTIEVEQGRPAKEIAFAARRHAASLVVLGLSHHSMVDRLIDGDTALELLRESDTPVLLASKDFVSTPKFVVIGVDFSPESMEAARASIPLLSPDCVIHLAHVRPSVTIFDGSGLWEDEYEKVAAKQLDDFKETLAAPPTMRVETTILLGKPATALTEYANKIDADLIVSGTHGLGLMRRIFIGSVASGLLRKSERSLLLVPKPTHQQKKED
ncbi:MAG TPA: universal stress protein [Gemmatimonadaceae bacterium]|nr:universal stress protein [Gemmatimonadaceae bacterium]